MSQLCPKRNERETHYTMLSAVLVQIFSAYEAVRFSGSDGVYRGEKRVSVDQGV